MYPSTAGAAKAPVVRVTYLELSGAPKGTILELFSVSLWRVCVKLILLQSRPCSLVRSTVEAVPLSENLAH
jgi:hypothetical protein